MLRLRREGWTLREIAREFGVSHSAVGYHLQQKRTAQAVAS
jgi:predicted transcriptional regulator